MTGNRDRSLRAPDRFVSGGRNQIRSRNASHQFLQRIEGDFCLAKFGLGQSLRLRSSCNLHGGASFHDKARCRRNAGIRREISVLVFPYLNRQRNRSEVPNHIVLEYDRGVRPMGRWSMAITLVSCITPALLAP